MARTFYRNRSPNAGSALERVERRRANERRKYALRITRTRRVGTRWVPKGVGVENQPESGT